MNDEVVGVGPELPPLRRLLNSLPTQASVKDSEARRDAIVAVALAIKRRGHDPISGWTTMDVDAVFSIADILLALR